MLFMNVDTHAVHTSLKSVATERKKKKCTGFLFLFICITIIWLQKYVHLCSQQEHHSSQHRSADDDRYTKQWHILKVHEFQKKKLNLPRRLNKCRVHVLVEEMYSQQVYLRIDSQCPSFLLEMLVDHCRCCCCCWWVLSWRRRRSLRWWH